MVQQEGLGLQDQLVQQEQQEILVPRVQLERPAQLALQVIQAL